MSEQVTLRRALGFWALVAYGIGDILGAGIYALVGKIAGISGMYAWASFAVAMGVAALTAVSYAELGRRFPRSGGEAYFCQRAFGWPALSLLIGWLVFSSGVVSLATVSRAFADYALATWTIASGPLHLGTIGLFLLLLTGINFWGIRESSRVNMVCTLVECSGLIIVLVVGVLFLLGRDLPALPEVAPVPGRLNGALLIQGAALAFFAFIGFEDMVNVSEEVQDARRNVPRAIMTALLVAGSVYVLVAWVATRVVAPAELATAGGPLLLVVQRGAPNFPAWIFVIIALFAVANTGLLNYVMGSRLLYGMACEGLLPRWLATLHPRRQTPYLAILIILVVALSLAITGTVQLLAGTTSFLLLIVFATVNLSLVAIKYGEAVQPKRTRTALAIPLIAAATSLGLMLALPAASILPGGVILLLGMLLIVARRCLPPGLPRKGAPPDSRDPQRGG